MGGLDKRLTIFGFPSEYVDITDILLLITII